MEEIEQETETGGVRYAITETLQFWNFDNLNFHLNLEDKVRQSKTSYNSNKLKLHYQTVIRIVTTSPSDLPGYEKYTEEGGTHVVLYMSLVTEFWFSTRASVIVVEGKVSHIHHW